MPPPNEAPICFTATLTTVTSSWITANPRLAAMRVAVSGQVPGRQVPGRRCLAVVVMVSPEKVMPPR
jgi:hypothetical protein